MPNDITAPTDTAQPTLLLIDGSSYLYRAYHAGGDWSVPLPDGSKQPTGALRIMINMMQSLTKDYPATWAACVFDAKGETFRNAIYPQYKAQRPPMPDDLRSQIEPIHQMVQLLGFPVLAIEGVEADDVIGTLAKLAAAQGVRVIISSGDKDLSQLVDSHITVIDTMTGKRRDEAGVLAEFGVPPALMVDYQTLVGDTVDNVPGVEKVGPKTAVKWLTEYGTLDGVVQNASNIKGVVGENLRRALDWLPTGKQLVTIKTDCDLQAHIQPAPTWRAATQHPKHRRFARLLYTLPVQQPAKKTAQCCPPERNAFYSGIAHSSPAHHARPVCRTRCHHTRHSYRRRSHPCANSHTPAPRTRCTALQHHYHLGRV